MKTFTIRISDMTEKCLKELQNSTIYDGFSANMIIGCLIRQELKDLYPDVYDEINDGFMHVV